MLGGGSSRDITGCQRGLYGDGLHIAFELGGELFVFSYVKFSQRLLVLDGVAHQLPDYAVSLAEGDALLDQVIGQVGSKRVILLSGTAGALSL